MYSREHKLKMSTTLREHSVDPRYVQFVYVIYITKNYIDF